MKSSDLILAIEEGKQLSHNEGLADDHIMIAEPYRSHSNMLEFHFYGWGSAYWTTEGFIRGILSKPDQFKVINPA